MSLTVRPQLMSCNLKAYLHHKHVAINFTLTLGSSYVIITLAAYINPVSAIVLDVHWPQEGSSILWQVLSSILLSVLPPSSPGLGRQTGLVADDPSMWQVELDYRVPAALLEWLDIKRVWSMQKWFDWIVYNDILGILIDFVENVTNLYQILQLF